MVTCGTGVYGIIFVEYVEVEITYGQTNTQRHKPDYSKKQTLIRSCSFFLEVNKHENC